MHSIFRHVVCAIALPVLLAVSISCDRKPAAGKGEDTSTVTLYTSVDEPYVRPLVEQFTKQTGIRVTLLTDSEASKSVGLAERLRAERDRPQADVWWSNECFLTINLADEGVLEAYDSPASADIPARFKDAGHRWAGSVLRVRTLVSSRPGNGNRAAPTRLADLLRPDLKGQIALARPTGGTTGGHVAALYVLWGEDRARRFFRGLHDNGVTLVGGNSVVAESVARGDLRAGICDNDDAASAQAEIGKLESALPDQGEGEDGTLAMPCTAALVTRCRHSQAARRLIDFLLGRSTDKALIDAKFAWCSTRDASTHGRFMNADYREVAKAMPAAIREATALLEGR